MVSICRGGGPVHHFRFRALSFVAALVAIFGMAVSVWFGYVIPGVIWFVSVGAVHVWFSIRDWPTFLVEDGKLNGSGSGETWSMELASISHVGWESHDFLGTRCLRMVIHGRGSEAWPTSLLTVAPVSTLVPVRRLQRWRRVHSLLSEYGIPMEDPYHALNLNPPIWFLPVGSE